MPFILPSDLAPASQLEAVSSSEWHWEWPQWQQPTWLSTVPLHIPLALLFFLVFATLALRALFVRAKAGFTAIAADEKRVLAVELDEQTHPKWVLSFGFFRHSQTSEKATEQQQEETIEVVALPVVHRPRPQKAAIDVRRPERVLKLAVDAPLPAIYVSEVPASMAKLIMSRHTFRKASPPSPRRTRSLSPPKTAARPSTAPSPPSAPTAV
ncbi:hypothetical protein MIND_00651300 [Mycena indigotica]|uniref:Uncharacterized protein n=1 Tax=Mycena indigotica TaxID=2126181 RepID=A0A8H6SSP6_9AGAR|nr:uncharacterized protein MIND_00651300 [Mycena indigotica]KAF7304192.1 hypothetical protein MIND_00651300 [Mycena indigotica]